MNKPTRVDDIQNKILSIACLRLKWRLVMVPIHSAKLTAANVNAAIHTVQFPLN